MYAFLMTLFVLVAILMVVVILLQSSKGGLAGTFGGAGGGPGGVLGSRGAASFLQKATIALGLIFSLLCIAINQVGGQGFSAVLPRKSLISRFRHSCLLQRFRKRLLRPQHHRPEMRLQTIKTINFFC